MIENVRVCRSHVCESGEMLARSRLPTLPRIERESAWTAWRMNEAKSSRSPHTACIGNLHSSGQQPPHPAGWSQCSFSRTCQSVNFMRAASALPGHATRDVELVHVPLHVGCVLRCSAFLRPLPEFDAKCGSGLWEKVGMTRLTIDIERQSACFCLDL